MEAASTSSAESGSSGCRLVATEGCDQITTVEQKSFEDQGGTLKPRERFGGGDTSNSPGDRRYGSLKAIDPALHGSEISADWLHDGTPSIRRPFLAQGIPGPRPA